MATIAMLVVPALSGVSARAAFRVGFKAHSYEGFSAQSSGGAITGQKPESKLWFHDGWWWAAMLSPGAGGAHSIHRLSGDTWVDTGVVIDERPTTKEDVLSVGSTLYIVSRSSIGSNKLRRFSYDGAEYELDPGFPVDVACSGEETTTIARDTTGTLWITCESGTNIIVSRSQGSDTSWSPPFVLPGDWATGVGNDDISSVIAFTDATGPAIGVMWSNQPARKDFFAVHRDGAPAADWTVELALSGMREADDHINLKTFEDQVFAAVKTSKTPSTDPLIQLLVRSPSGDWSNHRVALVSEGNTRPITLMHIDPTQRQIYVFMTVGTAGGSINYKRTSLDNIDFPSEPTTFMAGGNGERINNATSMKANATAVRGIVVLASDGTSYWWNRIGSTSPPPPENIRPTAGNTAAATTRNTATRVRVVATDAETCELAFSIAGPPTNGTLGPVENSPCTQGTPNSDSASISYRPAPDFMGIDTFSFQANDGVDDSHVATVTITVDAPPPRSLIETTTTGKVCGHLCAQRRLEQFGAYTFTGRTRPSKKGQIVVYHFRRPWASKWRRFKVGPADGRNAFFILNRKRPRDKINSRKRWRVLFTPGVRPGRWLLRARFLRQDGFANSAIRRRVHVGVSE